MDISSSAYVAIGAITAAIIAGAISFISTVLSKDQKTSEFRQNWIDGLRNDIAELISIFTVSSDTYRIMIKAGKTKEEIFNYILEKNDIAKLEMVDSRIKLRINPKEHDNLLKAISGLHEYIGSEQIFDSKAANRLIDNLVQESHLVLKKEWKRVKRGEFSFIVTKVVSLIIFIVSLIIGGLYLTDHLQIKLINQPDNQQKMHLDSKVHNK